MQIPDVLGIQLFQLGTMWFWKDDRCLLADMQGFLYSPIYYNTAWPNQYRYFLGEQLPFYKFPIKCLERNLYCPVSLPLYQMIKFSFNILVCTQHRSLKSSNDFIKSPHIYRQKPVNCVGAPQHRVNQLMNEKHNDQPLLHLIKMKETLFWFFNQKKLGRPPTKNVK